MLGAPAVDKLHALRTTITPVDRVLLLTEGTTTKGLQLGDVLADNEIKLELVPRLADKPELGYVFKSDIRVAAAEVLLDGVNVAEVVTEIRRRRSPPPPSGTPGTESYAQIHDNPFETVGAAPLSTFGVDVDTASYSNIRRFLNDGQLPPPQAVRIEELVNAFDYDYAEPDGDAPFSSDVEITACPWNLDHRLVRVGVQGKTIPEAKRPSPTWSS